MSWILRSKPIETVHFVSVRLLSQRVKIKFARIGAIFLLRPEVVMSHKTNLIGMDENQLAAALLALDVPEKNLPSRVAQLWNGIYVRGFREFSQMVKLGQGLIVNLEANFCLRLPEIVTEQISNDGTRKWLLRMPPGNPAGHAAEIETVFIPEPGRGTVCVSSQVGCSLSCTFCHTGTQRMERNLTAAEMVGQILLVQDRLAAASDFVATNVVLMGMGEPLFNFENVKSAMLIARSGMGFSRRRITLSTSGVVPGIHRTGEELRIMLAISLHAVRDDVRDELVPINRKYPIAELLDACRRYRGASNSRRITFEYVMLAGVNDSLADAKELVRLLKDIPAKINLIPFNPWPGSGYECSDEETIQAFTDHLHEHGYVSPLRRPRGQDIMAACGQLKSIQPPLTV